MKSEQIENLPIEWKRGNGLRKSDLDETGKNKCILYGELYTKHKTVLIDSQTLSKTNKQGKVYSQKGDILIPGTSTAAKKDMLLAREVNDDGILLGGDINIIRPKQGFFAQKYLPYYFMTQMAYQQLDRYITGATGIIHISNKGLKKLKVPLLSLPEQQRIVKILDKAFVAIDKAKQNAEQNLRNAKEVFQSKLQSIFDNGKLKVENGEWEEKEIKDLTELVTKGSSPNWQGINYVEENGIFFLTSKNVGEGELILDNKKYLEKEFNDIQKKSILKKGDVLTNIVGASIGRTAIFNLSEVTNINQAVCLMRCLPEKIYNYYLMYLLNSPFFKNILHDNEVNNARANLSLTFFKKLSIPLPKIKEQKQIVENIKQFLIETEKLEAIYQQKLDNLSELKKSILQKAFEGEL